MRRLQTHFRFARLRPIVGAPRSHSEPGVATDARVGEVFQLVLHPKFGYGHVECQLPRPAGLQAGDEALFLMQLMQCYPKARLLCSAVVHAYHEFNMNFGYSKRNGVVMLVHAGTCLYMLVRWQRCLQL